MMISLPCFAREFFLPKGSENKRESSRPADSFPRRRRHSRLYIRCTNGHPENMASSNRLMGLTGITAPIETEDCSMPVCMLLFLIPEESMPLPAYRYEAGGGSRRVRSPVADFRQPVVVLQGPPLLCFSMACGLRARWTAVEDLNHRLVFQKPGNDLGNGAAHSDSSPRPRPVAVNVIYTFRFPGSF
ncbi:hypothetical protein BDV10DRAFT_45910 [Aspergillus recurvatus]